VVESGAVTVSGFPVYRLASKLRSQQGLIHLLSYLIQKDYRVYIFHGFTSANLFKGYYPTLEGTIVRFKELTDPSKLNVKPARISIRSAQRSGTLRHVLRDFGTPEDKMESLALLNGMRLNDQVAANTLLKVEEK
jgi:predicted Zn-dependent protease